MKASLTKPRIQRTIDRTAARVARYLERVLFNLVHIQLP
jgi:hypothetical protein